MAMKVLLIEDDALLGMAMEDMFGDLGCEVVGVMSAYDAVVDVMERNPPDFALLDMNLNGASSVPIAQALACRGVRVAFCTGYGNGSESLPEDLKDCVVLGKPVSERELLTLLGMDSDVPA